MSNHTNIYVFTNMFSWNIHIYHLIANWASTNVWAFKTVIIPELEYASVTWSSHQYYLIYSLESILNKAVRFIARDYSAFTSVFQPNSSLGLATLDRKGLHAYASFIPSTIVTLHFRHVHCKRAYYIHT